MKKGSLTLKQQQFCLEYVKDFNATKAAIRAGYSSKTARSIGHENLTKPDIQNYLQNIFDELQERTKLSTISIINVLVDFVMSDISEAVEFNDNGEIRLRGPSRHVRKAELTKHGYKVEMHDKMRALELLLNYTS